MYIYFLAQVTSSSKTVSIFESILIVIRDSSWQFIGVVVSLIALFFTYKQLNRKSLGYSVISKSNILSIPPKFSQKLEIKYNQSIIKSLYVVTIILKNNGNIAIKPDDFMQALEIRGGYNKKILSYDVIETKPVDIKVNIDLNTDANGDYVVIQPLLLNKKDILIIQLLFENFEQIYIQGRIIDIEKIKEFDTSFNPDLLPILLQAAGIAILTGTLFGIIFPLNNILSAYVVSIGILSTLSFLVYIFRSRY